MFIGSPNLMPLDREADPWKLKSVPVAHVTTASASDKQWNLGTPQPIILPRII